MKFSDVIGQKNTIDHLIRMVENGRVGHALLFSGQSGWGGMAVATAFAQYLNCTDRQSGDSCGVCPACLKTAAYAHPDVNYVFPVNRAKGKDDSSKKPPLCDEFMEPWREMMRQSGGYFDEPQWYARLKLDNKQGLINRSEASDILHKIAYKSVEGRYKIIIMWMPERMQDTAANALLKMIEEPWDCTLFLLVSEHPEQILPTIRSRVQEIPLHALENDTLAEALVQRAGFAPQEAAESARIAMGNYLTAIQRSAGGDAATAEMLEWLRRLLSFAAVNRHTDLMDWAEEFSEATNRETQKQFIANALRVLRECYMIQMNMPQVVYTDGAELELCRKIAPYVHSENFERIVSEFERLKRDVVQNGNGKILFTQFALQLSKLIYKPR